MLLLAMRSLGPRGLDWRSGETCFRRRDELLGAGLGNELQQLRETMQRNGKRRVARRLECCNCSGTGQSSGFEVHERSTKKKSLPSLGIPSEALFLISDRQCNIDTLDTITDTYLKARARWSRTERADPQRQPQATHSTATRQENEVRMSAEQEAEKLERQEEEFQEAFDGSEEDVFGRGVTWDDEENVAREEQERNKPQTKLQTIERMTKRQGQKMMEQMRWKLGTALG